MTATDDGTDATVRFGWLLLAVSIPLGVTLETLHGFKIQVYLASSLRREMWTLAHAHGNLLGILCLVYGSLATGWIGDPQRRRRISRWLRIGALLIPLGFLLGGVLNTEGDPSPGILLVPAGAIFLFLALFGARNVARPPPDP